jgi:hypothetical protein
MASKQVLDYMAELYQGEMVGEIFAAALLPAYEDPLAKRVLLAILQAESETKVRLRPAMVRLGVPVEPAADLQEQADALLAGLKGLSWTNFLAAIRVLLADQGVSRFREIAQIASADGDPQAIEVANYMVIHETAFLEMVDRLIAGDPNPTRGVDALMHFPIPAAAA